MARDGIELPARGFSDLIQVFEIVWIISLNFLFAGVAVWLSFDSRNDFI